MSCRAHKIDLNTFPRRAQFEYFSAMAYPYVGVTANVDISALEDFRRKSGAPFFLSLLYAASRAANSVPQLRQRIRGGEIWEYDWCPSSHTVAKPDGTYAYCRTRTELPFGAYLDHARAAQDCARSGGDISEDAEDSLPYFFVSSLPWLQYTALVQPVPSPADSNPRITWGKSFEQDGRTLLPLSLLCHHALADGLHISQFYQAVERELNELPHRI